MTICYRRPDNFGSTRTRGSKFCLIEAITVCLFCGVFCLTGGIQPLRADDTPPDTIPIYTGTDTGAGADTTSPVVAADAEAGPVRLVRFSLTWGNVSWRGSSDGDWSDASINLPLREGSQIWTSDHSRAEVQFDDGSRVGIASNTIITLQTLYSDAKGEFTEIVLNNGQITAHLLTNSSTYQFDTRLASVNASGAARLLIVSGDTVYVQVRDGSATVEGKADKEDLTTGQYTTIADDTTPYSIQNLPAGYQWDAWDEQRDARVFSTANPNLPPNIALCAGDLDKYGRWYDDPVYQQIWVPNITDPSWRPYYAGHWTWVDPFGWTWVSSERWGWAPYHYGAWIHSADYGWAWVPGPEAQYWSPGVVSFYQDGDQVAWCPLAPGEVRYPSDREMGFHPGWSGHYSVYAAAVYYPGANNRCFAHPWRNETVNQIAIGRSMDSITVNDNRFGASHFVPSNARFGGSFANRTGFGKESVVYHRAAPSDVEKLFNRGKVVTGPASGRPTEGWQTVRPTAASFSPTRSFKQGVAPPQVLSRPVFRTSLPARVVETRPQRAPASGPPSIKIGGQTNNPKFGGYQTNPGGQTNNPRGGNTGNPGGRQTNNPKFGGYQTNPGGQTNNPRGGNTGNPGGQISNPKFGGYQTNPGGQTNNPRGGNTGNPGGQISNPKFGGYQTNPGGQTNNPRGGNTGNPGGQISNPKFGGYQTNPGGQTNNPRGGNTGNPGGQTNNPRGSGSTGKPGGQTNNPKFGGYQTNPGSHTNNPRGGNTGNPGGPPNNPRGSGSTGNPGGQTNNPRFGGNTGNSGKAGSSSSSKSSDKPKKDSRSQKDNSNKGK